MKNNKLKKLENLKLRTSTFGLRNKLGIIAIVCLLIFAGYSGVNATIKLGNDGTTDWSMVDTDKIRTSNGKSFPATATGLQDAFYSLNDTNGGTTWLPSCSILNCDNIRLISNLTVIGMGNSTLLRLADGVALNHAILVAGFLSSDVGKENINIEKIQFDGNKVGQTDDAYCIRLNVSKASVKNCYFHDSWEDGLLINYYASKVIVDGCWFIDCGSIDSDSAPLGILIEGDYNTVVNSYFENCLWAGIAIESGYGGAQYNVIDGNIITGTKCNQGIHLEASPSPGSDSIISNNIIYNLNVSNTSCYGIQSAGENITIIGNYIYTCRRGITITGSDIVCSDNNIFNVTTYGIFVNSVKTASITGNNINDTYKTGIYVYKCHQALISDNNLRNTNVGGSASEAGIHVEYGSNNTVNSNIVNTTGYHGIYDLEATAKISNNYIMNTTQNGINNGRQITDNTIVDSGGYGIYATLYNHQIIGNYIDTTTGDGIRIARINTDSSINNNFIVDAGADGINIYVSSDVLCMGNTVLDSVSEGICLTTSDNCSIHDNMVSKAAGNCIVLTASENNTIYGNRASTASTGLYDDGTSANNVFINNFVVHCGTGIDSSGTGSIVRSNIGYITESGGANASTVDSGTITHGLASTPTYVLVTGSIAGEMVSVTALGATTFTVAIKDHAGNAGTSQTIYWRAYYVP